MTSDAKLTTPLAAELMRLRQKYIAEGGKLFTLDEIEAELGRSLAAAPTNAAPQEGQSGNWPLGQSGTPTNAAPQPSTADVFSAPSQEGVGQGDAAVAAPNDTPSERDPLLDRLNEIIVKHRLDEPDCQRDREVFEKTREAAAKECEQESTGDGITGTYQASWGRYLAGAVRALNVDEIIGRGK